LVLEQGAGEGKLHSLQRCFEASTGELIYLTDADCVIEELAFFLCVNPILTEGEQVVTGSLYLPLPEQVSNEFVQSQMAVRAYSSASHEKYSTGLLGGNAVIRRGALAEVEAFQHGVPTGTDYDLAKRLLRQGVRIRYQLHASIHSEFPTHPRAYLRQQARWIRNVVIYGLPYGAYTEVFACLRTSFVGLAMMLGPVIYLAIALWRGPLSMAAALAGLGWALIFLQALLSRIRYQRFSEIWLQTPANAWKFGRQALYLWLDFAVWSVPLLEYPIQSRRERW
jgi:cellulose synthase/poly-beta-1,6-N-acetylglucosamine synthase-like glycosyltransferase